MAKNEKGTNLVEKIFELARPLCDELSLVLWDVVFEKEGTTWYLRIYIDKEEGYVDIDDCENFHRPFSDILDREDPIEQDYIFETCSPGLGRTLRRDEHFLWCIGCDVKIKAYKPLEAFDGQKEFVANLVSFEDKKIWVMYNGSEVELLLSECAKISLNDDADLF